MELKKTTGVGKSKPVINPVGFVIGIGAGLAIGVALNNIAIGVAIGAGLGLFVFNRIGQSKKKSGENE